MAPTELISGYLDVKISLKSRRRLTPWKVSEVCLHHKIMESSKLQTLGDSNFRVSLVDNKHSRTAGLIGLFGVLGMSSQEIFISDPCTGEPKISFKWFQFHQFHHQAPAQPVDKEKVIVMHTSGEFPAGPGQLYLYCEDGSNLLNHLVAKGKLSKSPPGIISSRRLSRSEGDLCCASNNFYLYTPDSPSYFRSKTDSEDSGVRVSVSSDDSGYVTKSKNASSNLSVGIALITKTPGESETEDSSQDLANIDEEFPRGSLPRRESGVSLASGIYEEIPDDYPKISPNKNDPKYTNHVYENPLELILGVKSSKYFSPPPLPPRRLQFSPDSEERYRHSHYLPTSIFSPFKPRSHTLPAKDLSKLSQIFTAESDYVVMSPSKTLERPRKPSITESLYMPMSRL
ncbi:hypothetical protein NQ314_013357 [Rhamnusium bicolor]|uniref:Uncharacterized protein n=1 Tax=Rhamnusium bicolor TaxID=1586634 RepID=A0AAV8X6A6_9CUCU|nr:hypothetical protein NQ314_013357 [Rhamnusium bicolor]